MHTPPLQTGDPAPDFERPDHLGHPFRLSALRGKPVVLFFYPKDFTPACTAQACSFRDAYENFARAGAEVVGISTGSTGTHASFAQRLALPFRLIVDDGSIRALFRVPRSLGLFPGRVTYVLDYAGIIRLIFNSQWRIQSHIQEALTIIKSLATARAPE